MARKMTLAERRAKRKGVILEWRMGSGGEMLPVVMAKIVNKKEHVVSVISPYSGGINYHGGNPDTEDKDPKHYFCRVSAYGSYFFQLPVG